MTNRNHAPAPAKLIPTANLETHYKIRNFPEGIQNILFKHSSLNGDIMISSLVIKNTFFLLKKWIFQ